MRYLVGECLGYWVFPPTVCPDPKFGFGRGQAIAPKKKLGGREQASEDGDVLTGEKGEGTATKHAGREIAHDRLCLDMEVSQHFIGAPAAEELNDVGINLGAQQGHGAGGTEGASRDMLGEETVSRAEQTGMGAEECSNVMRGDMTQSVGVSVRR